MLSFYKQQLYFSQIVSKKAKITISFFMKNNNVILEFNFMYLVSVYPTNRKVITNYLCRAAKNWTVSRIKLTKQTKRKYSNLQSQLFSHYSILR